jgi:nucleotide-binding universal stress UspA family protein
MEKIKKILLPTDFSDNANDAFEYALEIANKSNAVLSLIHGAHQPYMYGADKLLYELADRNRYPNVRVETELIVGNILPKIFDLSADLIVMGTKGRSDFGNLLFGSVSATVLLDSKIPVMVIPQGEKYDGLKHLLCTTDMQPGDIKSLEKIAAFGKLFDSKITVMHVAGSDQEAEKQNFEKYILGVREKISYSKLKFEMLTHNDLHKAISDYVSEHGCDLVVFNRYKKPFFRSLFEKNKIKKAGYENIPLMVIPCEEI